MDKRNVYFVSDAHFGISLPGFENRERDFIAFLHEIAPRASHLFIVGDLFDFWIEYKRVIRREYFNILRELSRLIEGGTEIHYLAGNHDFALGTFLSDELGVVIHDGHLDIRLHEKNIHLFHGDGVLKSDRAYRVLRSLLRNPLLQKLYKMLHPNFGIFFASLFSGGSRYFSKGILKESIRNEYRTAAVKYLARESDITVFGHTHNAEIFEATGKTYCNTGEWIRNYNYAKLEGGKISLWSFNPEGEDAEIASQPLIK